MLPTKTDSRRRLNVGGSASPSGDYIKVIDGQTETDGFVNEQWMEPELIEPTPWKTILIILILFIGGTICICFATNLWMADINRERSDRVWALSIIGALTIIPGGYYMYVLYCILLHRRGFTMDDIRRLG
ncbi:transmembrane protein 230 [Drosophila miranda]|uniref:transmembrane protein 230 n=1 Tax=Drosophila miranda TaxID=7229 RepID=UPI0007E77000|nr:transmembrane protein 230 [Drosophila miranda]